MILQAQFVSEICLLRASRLGALACDSPKDGGGRGGEKELGGGGLSTKIN